MSRGKLAPSAEKLKEFLNHVSKQTGPPSLLAPVLTFKEYLRRNPPSTRQVTKVGLVCLLVFAPAYYISSNLRERYLKYRWASIEGNKLLADAGEPIVNDPRWS